MLSDKSLRISTLLRTFLGSISVTWLLTLCETALTALVPLFIGFAIDDLLNQSIEKLLLFAGILGLLIFVAVLRRIYDTRAYGRIRVEVSKALSQRDDHKSVSTLNARLGMGRELVDFLEQDVPAIMNAVVQLIVSLAVLFAFHPILSGAALGAAILMVLLYALFHGRFYRLNANHNNQVEKQVRILETSSFDKIVRHLNKIKRIEIQISDTEAGVYGGIFAILLSFILFNLWYAGTHLELTVGTIFSIISYSWEFVESALILPVTLQGWSRLSEIMARINKDEGEPQPE